MLPESSFIATLGLSFREAPTAVRAMAAHPLNDAAIEQLRSQGLHGLVEIHTCARSLWIISADHPAWTGALLQTLLARRYHPRRVLPVMKTGQEAIKFALRVSMGLDSHIQGEADIGRQVSGAFARAHSNGQSDKVLHQLQQSTHRLLARGRQLGCIRPNRGLGALAVAELSHQGIAMQQPIGVVGTGAIGRRVIASLRRIGRPFVAFNRSPGPEVLPMDAMAQHPLSAWILCTAGPEGWFHAPEGLVIDLGVPSQCRPEREHIGLDRLLSGDTLRLSPDRLLLAEQIAEQEQEILMLRLHQAGLQQGLSRLNDLRDQFIEQNLPMLMSESIQGLPEEEQRKLLNGVQRVVRQYSHLILKHIKEEFIS